MSFPKEWNGQGPRNDAEAQSMPQWYWDQDPNTALLKNWREAYPEIIGRSESMMQVLEMVSKISKTHSSVLILGESGTGKELIASALHRLSPRCHKNFVAINCSAFPENLLESELFGFEKGAFTSADKKHIGYFERAHGGTIFLDEIGEMPLHLQSKLLRVISEKKFAPLASTSLRDADVRIIAATNVDLQQAILDGKFRLDLYYRLKVLDINMPPVRERTGDVPLLLEHFLENANRLHALGNPCYFDTSVINCLSEYHWPGNVREMQNLVERLVVLRGGGRIDLSHLPAQIKASENTSSMAPTSAPVNRSPMTAKEGQPATVTAPLGQTMFVPDRISKLPEQGLNLSEYIESLENDLIVQALEKTNNNKNQAAKLLGMNRTTLVEKIKKRKIGPLTIDDAD